MKTDMKHKTIEGFAPFARTAATEGMVLLKNEGHVLPIREEEVVSVFGRCQIDYYKSGTGSGGSVHVEYSISALEGMRNNKKLEINEQLAALYEAYVRENPFDKGDGGWASEPWFQKEMELTETVVKEARRISEKAIILIGRTAGEEQDNKLIEGSYYLTSIEKDLLSKVTAEFEQVAVVLNTSNSIDMSWIEDYKIKAVLYAWQGGMEGGNALVDLLTGAVSPSAKLTDTLAYSVDKYPSHQNFAGETHNIYQEDVYVGYRYFETFDKESVMYPFGYGISYTNFDMEVIQIISKGAGIDTTFELDVKVTNIGDTYSGKEVVQVYFSAPQGVLGKPARELIAFAKTENLAPGSSQVMTLIASLNRMASYDDAGKTHHKSAYVLEAGTYELYVGSCVRCAKKEFSFKLEELLVVETLSEAMAPTVSFTRMKPGRLKDDGNYELEYEEVPVRTISIENRIYENLPMAYAQTGDSGIKLINVKEGKNTLEEFVAQLSTQQLMMLVRGEGMGSPKVTLGTASAFGGMSEGLLHYGIAAICCADGPSGIRMDTGQKATQVPIGTLLASSWNIELMEDLYVFEGQELVLNEIDTLLGPGMNIHRHPLNGRNFEYFSEDPFLTGCFAKAATLGLKKGGSTGTIKHFAANDQEKNRHHVNSIVSERALREIHLKPFELAVKEGEATTLMTAYNPINGIWAASNYDMNTTILRKEWGFKGIVMTDWWARMNDPVLGGEADRKFTSFMVRAQNDLYMVVDNDGAETNAMKDNLEEAVNNGTLTLGELQRSAINICKFILNSKALYREPKHMADVIIEKQAIDLEGADEVFTIEAQIPIFSGADKTVFIQIDDPGAYDFILSIKYDDGPLSQSSCSVLLNGVMLRSIQKNGSNGNWWEERIKKVTLEVGVYELAFNFIKPGMVIGKIKLMKCKS
jgi:beta-glucosidase